VHNSLSDQLNNLAPCLKQHDRFQYEHFPTPLLTNNSTEVLAWPITLIILILGGRLIFEKQLILGGGKCERCSSKLAPPTILVTFPFVPAGNCPVVQNMVRLAWCTYTNPPRLHQRLSEIAVCLLLITLKYFACELPPPQDRFSRSNPLRYNVYEYVWQFFVCGNDGDDDTMAPFHWWR